MIVNFDDIEVANIDIGGGAIYHYQDQPFTGTIQEFNSAGILVGVFYKWLENDVLGYNRNIVTKPGNNNVIMHTCADCYYITDLVPFIHNF